MSAETVIALGRRMHIVPPDAPRSRWDDGTCKVEGCPCPHRPPECDRGWSRPRPGSSTGGLRSGVGAPLRPVELDSDSDAVARCRICARHAGSRAEAVPAAS